MESPTFDIIFAGGEFACDCRGLQTHAHSTLGGTAACVVAGRLAALDPSLKILIIEGGHHSRDVPFHVHPCRYVEHLAPSTTTLSAYAGKPSTHLDGRSVVITCGRSVGGGSAVNCGSNCKQLAAHA